MPAIINLAFSRSLQIEQPVRLFRTKSVAGMVQIGGFFFSIFQTRRNNDNTSYNIGMEPWKLAFKSFRWDVKVPTYDFPPKTSSLGFHARFLTDNLARAGHYLSFSDIAEASKDRKTKVRSFILKLLVILIYNSGDGNSVFKI